MRNDDAVYERLTSLLKALRLPSILRECRQADEMATKEDWRPLEYLEYLVAIEIEDRRQRKVERLRHGSKLPTTKLLETLEIKLLPVSLRRRLKTIFEGDWVDRAENLLLFGLPGRGKSHLVSAIGNELIDRGYKVLFIETFRLVQQLLIAKRDLKLEACLRRLDRFDLVILDDIGYVQQQRDEMEVLFTFLAERYERKSIAITSNLVFSQWDRIFKDPMTTACAIERVVHHSIIIELTGKSYRMEEAKKQNKKLNQDLAAKEAKHAPSTALDDSHSSDESD
jgi:DNA replication protein DnaC